jgi:hypothetical protein
MKKIPKIDQKTTLTIGFMEKLGLAVTEQTIKEHMIKWWQNTRSKSHGGLGLTQEGVDVLKKIDIRLYEIPYCADLTLTSQVIIHADRTLTCPYYLGKKSIAVTDDKTAVELTLFSGDLARYLLVKADSKCKTT